MIPYSVLFITISLNAFLNKRELRHLNLVVFCFLALFYSLRYEVGTDWSAYEYYFYSFQDDYITTYSFEMGYWWLNYIASFFLSSFRYLVFVVGIFNCVIFWKATCKYTKNIGIIMLLSLFYLFMPTLEAFRQSITLFLFYYSLQYIEKNEKKYIFINILGSMFHYTGIFAIIFMFFNKYKNVRIIILCSMLSFSILEPFVLKVLVHFPVLYSKYYWYFQYKVAGNTLLTIKAFEYFLILVIYYLYYRKKPFDTWNKIMSNLLLIGFFIQVTLGQVSNIVYRITYYTDIGLMFAYVFIYSKIKNVAFKYIFIVFLIIYVFARFYRVFQFDNMIYHYKIWTY